MSDCPFCVAGCLICDGTRGRRLLRQAEFEVAETWLDEYVKSRGLPENTHGLIRMIAAAMAYARESREPRDRFEWLEV